MTKRSGGRKKKLTIKDIKKVIANREIGRHPIEKNLFLQITKIGGVAWVLRYTSPAGDERWMGLGPASEITRDEAVDKANEAKKQIRSGIDPLPPDPKTAKKAARALAKARTGVMTFKKACETYHQQNENRWRSDKDRKQWLSKLERFAFPIIGEIMVADIDRPLILAVLLQPYEGKTLWLALQSSDRLRQGLEQVLDWCTVHGHRTGDNPAALKLLKHGLPARPKNGNGNGCEHHPSLPFVQAGEFMGELKTHGGIAARALEFCILTAARAGEVIGARWGEIDLKAKTWTVPAERMKAGREHRVPLSDAAIAVLGNLHIEQNNDFVFIGNRNGAQLGNNALANVILAMNKKRQGTGLGKYVDPKEGGRDICVHGFRSCFRDWVSETTDFPSDLAEAALAHMKGDRVEQAYARGSMFDKRRRLMDAWAKFATDATPHGANVIVMTAR